MDELKEDFIRERRSKYATVTKQGMVASQAAQRAKRAIDFRESSQAFHENWDEATRKLQKIKLLRSTKALAKHKDKPLKRTPTKQRSAIPRGLGVLGNKRLWKRSGRGKDKYQDLFINI